MTTLFCSRPPFRTVHPSLPRPSPGRAIGKRQAAREAVAVAAVAVAAAAAAAGNDDDGGDAVEGKKGFHSTSARPWRGCSNRLGRGRRSGQSLARRDNAPKERIRATAPSPTRSRQYLDPRPFASESAAAQLLHGRRRFVALPDDEDNRLQLVGGGGPWRRNGDAPRPRPKLVFSSPSSRLLFAFWISWLFAAMALEPTPPSPPRSAGHPCPPAISRPLPGRELLTDAIAACWRFLVLLVLLLVLLHLFLLLLAAPSSQKVPACRHSKPRNE
ncbi:hypothetical protein CDD83_3180 [Cordyceps sp. RAO-2017]|nr:hypothetical protein CDD83_3180 [Cordyceps sp. RAO-2017]